MSDAAGIAAYLRARYDEIEALAIAARDDHRGYYETIGDARWHAGDETVSTAPHGITVVMGAYGFLESGVGQHIAANDPASVLADIDSKRAILAEHQPQEGYDGDRLDGQICGTCSWAASDGGIEGDPYPCTTVRLLARPFRERPDFPEGWKT